MPHHPTRRSALRSAGWSLAVVAILAVATACGSGSSGGHKASPGTTLNAAIALEKKGDTSQAKQLFLQVIKAQPNNFYAQYDLGVIAQNAGDNPGALAYYGAALTANPKYVPALYNEATIYATSDPTLAISTYRQVIVLQPNAPTASLNLGLLEVKHGAPKRGVKDMALAVREDPTLLTQIPKHLRTLVKAVENPASTPTKSSTPNPGGTTTTPSDSPS